MSQRYNTIYIPVFDDGTMQDELNRFLASRRVLAVEKWLVGDGLLFCIEWIDGTVTQGFDFKKHKEKVDYKNELSESEFEKFSRLRALRKSLAEKEAVAPYVICRDDQLAAMVRLESPSLAEFGKINGFGESRVNKYGEIFLSELNKE